MQTVNPALSVTKCHTVSCVCHTIVMCFCSFVMWHSILYICILKGQKSSVVLNFSVVVMVICPWTMDVLDNCKRVHHCSALWRMKNRRWKLKWMSLFACLVVADLEEGEVCVVVNSHLRVPVIPIGTGHPVRLHTLKVITSLSTPLTDRRTDKHVSYYNESCFLEWSTQKPLTTCQCCCCRVTWCVFV